jgi:TPR repeat protein
LRAEDVELDYEKATEWLLKAAKGGHAPAQYSLALRYKLGQGVEKDTKQEASWYQKAAKQGNSEARYQLALLLLVGDGIDKDVKKALSMLLNLSVQDHASAQYQLYKIYNKGEITNKDETLAKVYLHRASEGGHSISQYQLGQLYQEKQLLQDAIQWLSLSAKQNYAPAKALLVDVQAEVKKIAEEKLNSNETEVVDSVPVEAMTVQASPAPIVNFKLDAKTFAEEGPSLIPNQNQISRSLASNTKVMTNVEKLVISAKQGNPIAQHNLSTLFSIGAIVPKDNRKAFMLMQEAAKQGLTQSQNSLAMMYINGVGAEPDYQSAYFWASTSARQGDQEGQQILLHLISIVQ